MLKQLAYPKITSTDSLTKKLTPARVDSFTCPEGKKQDFLRDTEQPGLGLRVTATGAKSYIFQGKLAGDVVRMTIGDVKTLALSQARDKAAELRVMIRAGRDPRIVKADRVAADIAKRLADKQHREAAIEAKKHTFEKMLFAYCDYLQALGRDSHKDARSIFNLHVVQAWPKVAVKPATEVTPEEIADMMRLLFEAGKGRTANKLRSYVRAAYAVAKSARTKPSIPVLFKNFKVIHNPAAETSPDSSKNKADKNPLLLEDLLAYWQIIKSMDGLHGAVLRLHLLTGGQRIAQLVKLLTADITPDTITIYDGKGRPGTEPRPHSLPLIPAAKKALDEAASGGSYALSTDGGKTNIHPTTLLEWAQEATKDALPGFTSKRIRSGVETLLSKQGFSREMRGRLQSHGIAGVQDRHYDGHDYLLEKRRMLMALYNILEQKKTKVIPLHRNAA